MECDIRVFHGLPTLTCGYVLEIVGGTSIGSQKLKPEVEARISAYTSSIPKYIGHIIIMMGIYIYTCIYICIYVHIYRYIYIDTQYSIYGFRNTFVLLLTLYVSDVFLSKTDGAPRQRLPAAFCTAATAVSQWPSEEGFSNCRLQ